MRASTLNGTHSNGISVRAYAGVDNRILTCTRIHTHPPQFSADLCVDRPKGKKQHTLTQHSTPSHADLTVSFSRAVEEVLDGVNAVLYNDLDVALPRLEPAHRRLVEFFGSVVQVLSAMDEGDFAGRVLRRDLSSDFDPGDAAADDQHVLGLASGFPPALQLLEPRLLLQAGIIFDVLSLISASRVSSDRRFLSQVNVSGNTLLSCKHRYLVTAPRGDDDGICEDSPHRAVTGNV